MSVNLSDLINNNFYISSYAQLNSESIKLFEGKSINYFLEFVAENYLINVNFNVKRVPELIDDYKRFHLFLINGRVVKDFNYLIKSDDSLMFFRKL